jgi:hypothetical protein
MDAELRRNQNLMIQSGIGVLVFGIWGIIRTLMLYAFSPDERKGLLDVDNMNTTLEIILVIVMFVVFFSFDMLLRFYICRRAIAEARGWYRGNKYLVLTGMLAIVSILSIVLYVTSIVVAFMSGMDERAIANVVSVLVEFTSLEILTGLIKSARRMRKLRRELESTAEYNKS